MKKTSIDPRKNTNQLAKHNVDLSIDKLNKAADTHQSKKEQAVYTRLLNWKSVVLSEKQDALLRHACRLALQDNGNGIDNAFIAGKVYLNLILDFPDLSLPPLKNS